MLTSITFAVFSVTLSRHILKAGLYFIGSAAILIGSAIVVFGIQLVGEFFSAVIEPAREIAPQLRLIPPIRISVKIRLKHDSSRAFPH